MLEDRSPAERYAVLDPVPLPNPSLLLAFRRWLRWLPGSLLWIGLGARSFLHPSSSCQMSSYAKELNSCVINAIFGRKVSTTLNGSLRSDGVTSWKHKLTVFHCTWLTLKHSRVRERIVFVFLTGTAKASYVFSSQSIRCMREPLSISSVMWSLSWWGICSTFAATSKFCIELVFIYFFVKARIVFLCQHTVPWLWYYRIIPNITRHPIFFHKNILKNPFVPLYSLGLEFSGCHFLTGHN